MNCNHIKQNIYTYDELTDAQRKSVDDHIAQCNQCTQLFQQIEQQHAIFSEASLWKDHPADPDKLTRKIMSSIVALSREPVRSKVVISHQFNLAVLRMTFASVSLFLIVFFISELNMTRSVVLSDKADNGVSVSESKVVLNSRYLIGELRHKKKQALFASFYDCMKQCGLSDYQCLSEKCKTRFKKIVKRYENS